MGGVLKQLVQLAVTSFCLVGCGGSPSQPSQAVPPPPSLQLTTTTFSITYTAADAGSVSAIANSAEASVARIREALGVSQGPRVRVTYYATHAELAAAVRPFVGTIPSWATGVVTAGDAIHLLSSAAAGPDQIAAAATTLIHEFAHCVTLQLVPGSGNNPRWLWETIALYYANQFRDPTTVGAFRSGGAPTLSTLNGLENTVLYEVGFLLGEFIIERGGSDALRRLVQLRGDTMAALELSEAALVSEWRAWIRARHGV